MEFLAGIIFTLFVEFIAWKIYQARQQRNRLPKDYKPQTPKDFVNPEDRLR